MAFKVTEDTIQVFSVMSNYTKLTHKINSWCKTFHKVVSVLKEF